MSGLTQEDVLRDAFRYQDALTSYAYGLLRDWSLAQDVVQESFLVLLKKWEAYRPEANLYAWVRQMVRFEALNTLRARRKEKYIIDLAGKEVLVCSLPPRETRSQELRTEYDERVTGEICDEVLEAARRVVQQLGVRFAGVDLLLTDPKQPLTVGSGVFLELNTTPGIHHHYIEPPIDPPVAVRVLNGNHITRNQIP